MKRTRELWAAWMWQHGVLCLGLALALATLPACPTGEVGDPDYGPVEATIDEVSMVAWPGQTREDGSRYVHRLNGFFDGVGTSYWFIGFASRITADVFFFCPEGAEGCPFDDRGALAWDKMIGDPVFARLPGQAGYSPFWLAWTVAVPETYEANEIKTLGSLETATDSGRVAVQQAFHDYGGEIGPDEVLLHCLLVLEGTELEDNGAGLVFDKGYPSREVPLQAGWHEGYRLGFFDFTATEGVFPPDLATESRPLFQFSDIFVMFRDCENGSAAPVCELVNGEFAAVSERGVETDITSDGDKADTNNVVAAIPGEDPVTPGDKAYSPLWRVNVVKIKPENDAAVTLIDDTQFQDETQIKSLEQIRAFVDEALVHPPEFMPEGMAGNSIPGNDGKVFFNCPSQVQWDLEL